MTISRIEVTRALARYRSAIYDAYVARARVERVLGSEELPTDVSRPLLAQDFTEERGDSERGARPPQAARPKARATPQRK